MRLRKQLIFGLSLWLLLAATCSPALTAGPSEYQVKAAFLYNFAKFVDWPGTAFKDEQTPFCIGILGDNPFGNDFAQMVAGKKISDRAISVLPLHTAAEAAHCQILFVSSSEKKQFAEILRNLKGTAVLTVSEADGFMEAGGMVNFVKEADKIRFQINDDAARAVKLKISSKLLSLAILSPH